MNALQLPKMVVSFHAGWDDLVRIHPSVVRLFAWVVLPLSLLPPAMIAYAGSRYGDVFVPGVSAAQWRAAALIFLAAELLTVPVVAWLIRAVARMNDVKADYHACFTLAVVAPIPLWLSSLTLLVPNLIVGVIVGGLAMCASFGLIYHGVYALLRMSDDVRAFQMASVVAGMGLLMWLLLMQIVLVH